jgi:phospholipid/cholesterol/gamma-HCH transport system substrate-binding protein
MSRRYEIGVGCLVVVAVGLLGFMALQVGAIAGPRDTVDVRVLLGDAAGLSEGAVVSIAGVQIGKIDSLRIDFDRAVAEVSLNTDAQVRKDAQFRVRARSVLGEKYLEVVPRTREAPLLEDGDEIVDVAPQLEIDELVTRMGPLIDALDPEAVRALGRALTDDPERAGRMLDDAEKALHNVATASDALPALATESRAAIASVKRTSDDARPLLARLDGTARRVDEIVQAVPPDQVPRLLAEVEAAVKDGRAVITSFDGTSEDLSQLLDKANGITEEDIERFALEKGVLIRLRPRKHDRK